VQTLRLRLVAAGFLAAIAFSLYCSTLLPGQDLGDTASFQAVAGRHDLTVRQGYPLYYAGVNVFVRHLPFEPARSANLASAVAAALAVGLVVLAGAELAGSLAAGLVAACLFAGSFTFWSQSIIAEVYALHVLCAVASLLALLVWYRRPSLARLGVFFGSVALGFGNHLSMVLLLPGFAAFLLVASPGGPRALLRPRVVALAAAVAALFAMQYGWNFRSMVADPTHPAGLDLLRDFWFDVTKSDWRATMVEGIPWSSAPERFSMYWFDVRQQFGVPGIAAAVAGLAWLFRRNWRLGTLLALLFLVNWWFAFRYNVGDVHVFFIPSHWAVALAAGCAAAWVVDVATGPAGLEARPARVSLAVLLLLAYPAWRMYDTFPAVDRSDDREPTRFYDRLTAGIDGNREILGTDLNWQLHNGFDYYAWNTRPDLVVFDVSETLLYFPLLVGNNASMGRTVVLTEGCTGVVRDLYGALYTIERDPRLPVPSLAEQVEGLPAGTPYVLTVMEPDPPATIDQADLAAASARLGLLPRQVPAGRYAAVAGLVGERPVLRVWRSEPFRERATLAGLTVDVRIESFLPYDTIRRAGFGSVVANRHHALTIDRGVSFVALGPDGRALRRAWLGGLFAPQPRYLVKPGR
jgi:hypothetical protein